MFYLLERNEVKNVVFFFGWDIILELWPFPLNGLQVDSSKKLHVHTTMRLKEEGVFKSLF